MKYLDNYLNYIFEQQNSRTRGMNAPEFAYYTLYGKKPDRIRGRTDEHAKKKISGIEIDRDIPSKTIKELFKIKEIEMRSSCQGSSEIRPSFIIFRPKNQDEKYVKKLVKNLNKQNEIKSQYDLGQQGKYRICVTWKTWAGKDGNEEWWLSLPDKIRKSV